MNPHGRSLSWWDITLILVGGLALFIGLSSRGGRPNYGSEAPLVVAFTMFVLLSVSRGWVWSLVGGLLGRPIRSPRLRLVDWLLVLWSVYVLAFLAVVTLQGQRFPADQILILLLIMFLPAVLALFWRLGSIHHLFDPPPPPPEPVDESAFPPPTSFTIMTSKATQWRSDAAIGLTQSILRLAKTGVVEFSIAATDKHITFKVLFHHGYVDLPMMTATVQSFYPHANVVETEAAELTFPLHRAYVIFTRSQNQWFFESLRRASDLKAQDPLALFTQTADALKPGETLDYRIQFLASVRFPEEAVDELVTQSMAEAGKELPRYYRSEGFADALVDSAIRGWKEARTRIPRFAVSDERRHRAKLSQLLYRVSIVLRFDTPTAERLDWFNTATVPIEGFSHPDHPLIEEGYSHRAVLEDLDAWIRQLPSTKLGDLAADAEGERNSGFQEHDFLLTVDELAAVWHLPCDAFSATRILWAEVPVPDELTQEQDAGVYIGDITHHGQQKVVYLTNQDRAYHTYTSGQTGMGKSTLMHHLIHQDIAAGRGVAVIDPHGKLIDEILAASIPDSRLDDVVLLECGQSDYPVPLNPFRIPEGVAYETAFNYLYWLWRKIYEGVWSEGRMDRVLRNVLRTLLLDPEATPLDMQRLLTHGGYRAELLDRLKERRMRSTVLFWQEYNELSDGMQSQLAQPILNRTEVLLGGVTMERMTCHPHTLNFQGFVEQEKVVLINLVGDAIQSEVNNLGAMFLSGFYIAFRALGYQLDDQSPRFYLYVDEVERYVTSPIPDMFSEARKFGLSLMLANQYFDQLSSETLNGILGNAGTLLAFESGEKDARALAAEFEPEFDRQALQNLGAFHVAVKTRYEGQTLPAFKIRTRPPLPRSDGSSGTFIRQSSQGGSRRLTAGEVDAWLDARYYAEDSGDAMEGLGSTDGLGDYE